MIDVVAVIAIMGLLALGARLASNEEDIDRNNTFCIGICTHTVEKQRDPEDPNDPEVKDE